MRTASSGPMLLLAVVIFTCGAARAGTVVTADRTRWPNVVLVTIDTARADHLSVYGYGRPTTPELERLARDGVVFEAAYTATPTTGPAHATLFTSTYPARHGVLKNGYVLDPVHTTLAEVLGSAGYRTAAVPSSFVLTKRFGLAQGFEHYDDDFTGAHASLHPEKWEGMAVGAEFDRRASETTDRAVAWLDSLGGARERPFFLWVHYFDPHHPYDPPDGYRRQVKGETPPPDRVKGLAEADAAQLRKDILAYDAEIRYADEQIGRLLRHVDATAGREATLVIVTTDHGEGLLQHGWMQHGVDLYEELVRVALIVRWPGRLRAGVRVPGPVALVDVMPTLLALLELPPNGLTPQGGDVSSALRGTATLPADRPLFFHRRLYEKPERRGHDTRHPMFGIRRGRWKYVESGPTLELYDLEADPGETRNVRDGERETADRLAAELAEWRKRTAPVEAGRQSISDSDRERLRALGYVD
jgi:arylsulfatase A-like enzyme